MKTRQLFFMAFLLGIFTSCGTPSPEPDDIEDLVEDAKKLEEEERLKRDSADMRVYLQATAAKFEADKAEIAAWREYEIERQKSQLANDWLNANKAPHYGQWGKIVQADKAAADKALETKLPAHEAAKTKALASADSLAAHAGKADKLGEGGKVDYAPQLSEDKAAAEQLVEQEAKAYQDKLAEYKKVADEAKKAKDAADAKAAAAAAAAAKAAAALAEAKRCRCRKKTFRSVSDHTWVEFRLPEAPKNQVIQIEGGAYNKYVFPKCNRVYWSDLTFKCDCGTWKKTRGDWDADALCHGSKGNSPYVAVGNR